MKKYTARLTMVGLSLAISAAAMADLTPYSQDFESLIQSDPAALANNGWLVFGNVFESNGNYVYGYGPFPAPNPGGGFCAIATGEGGPLQGLQYLNTYSDYNNGDHAIGRKIEANIFQERTIGAADLGKTYTFTFDYKASSQVPPSGQTTAFAFIKVLNPFNGYSLDAFPTVETTTASITEWRTGSISITIDNNWTGFIFQIGFMNTATQYQNSGVFYDNVLFNQATGVTGTVSLSDYTPSPSTKTLTLEIYSADGNTLLQTISGVTMDASGNFNAAHSQAAGTYDIYVKADHWLRKLANDVTLSPSGSIGSISLTNGDVDGDNEVGPGDFGQLATAFLSVDGDPNWNANADLDGDGEVGPGDFGILANNFLSSGD